MTTKIPVAVVGATGVVGQEFVTALAQHPQYEIVTLAGSSQSAGKPYAEAVRGAAEVLPPRISALTVTDATKLDLRGLGVVFSALESNAARELEACYAVKVPVISTASAFRYDDDVPILVPGINREHLGMIEHQRKQRGWRGFIVPQANCTVIGLAITLAPLHKQFGVRRVFMVSLQSCTGAGRSSGVLALDIIDNVIPYIPREEEKVAIETCKTLGTIEGNTIRPADIAVSATCTRVPVLTGHTEAVFVELAQPATEAEIMTAWQSFGTGLNVRYPSAPEQWIWVKLDPFSPQPRRDCENADGMATTVGRLRRDAALPHGWKYVLVSHNSKMGAAKGAVLMAEILAEEGYL